ncbi:amino acid transporter [Sanghuangporus baumii]|uniref:Amino acid transporter n=1 Tax=Sanghuangporus baumii TaxID=108892 RepID=A0A9Q5I0K1_SANBA|nr:amino acid transporter [Sanghuangporus baumii]
MMNDIIEVEKGPEPENPVSATDKRLEELGYQPQFRRNMSLFGVLGMSFCAIGILTGMSSAFQTGLFSGGPLGLFWGWNLRSVSNNGRIIFLGVQDETRNTDARLLYGLDIHDSYDFYGDIRELEVRNSLPAPVLRRSAGLVLGLESEICTMIFTGTSGNLSTALYIASLAEIRSGRALTRVEIAALAWGVNILSGLINTVGTVAIGRMSAFNVWWTLAGTVVLAVTLLVKAPSLNPAGFVFTDFENFSGWRSKGFVVLLGFLQAVYSLEGCETAAQVAEEAVRAEILAPLAIVFSIVGSWIVGVAYMLALLFSVQSIPAIQQTNLALPIAQLFLDAAGSKLALLCLVVVGLAQGMAAATAFTASARLLYALARDNAVPAAVKGPLMKLNRGQAPYIGVWTSVLIGCVISCAYIGSSIAFNAILSSAAVAVMLSYLQPIIIRVFWPLSLKERGPFTLGSWSWSINFLSFLFTVFVCVLFILPTAHPTNAQNMNYAIVAIGGLLVITTSMWVFWGRSRFIGPVKTVLGPPNARSAEMERRTGEQDEKSIETKKE